MQGVEFPCWFFSFVSETESLPAPVSALLLLPLPPTFLFSLSPPSAAGHHHFKVLKIDRNLPLFIRCPSVLQFIIVELLHDFAKTTSLTWQQWLFCIVVGSIR